MNEYKRKIDLRAVMEEYRPEESIFVKDERMQRVKSIISNELSDADRIIILVYAETQSYRELGKMLGVSHTSI